MRHSAKISVLNGTGTQGLAAQKVSALANAGFDGASAANARGWDTEVTTVYYEDPNLKPTAEEVANVLGISRVVQTQTGDPDVVVVLKEVGDCGARVALRPILRVKLSTPQ